ncbi:hypothetical protein GKC30_01730 [Pseudodesulfovibrio sp. F-1]|uniref:Uncharacterized protein n=1 Tax=Pseudodesulfovibrio alkaliphilus TaxID=2661613 RepID=A0A7K1KJW7_9BACT|nr:hypothetical protein [Pseudodesulfovibrio alkaliphilus]MUM76349.1 hypothetical protein [Pseudodesulfovibrio alkaliphilus]
MNRSKRMPLLGAAFVLGIAIWCVALFAPGFFGGERAASDGLSGLVSVKGTVSLKALELTGGEVMEINRAVQEHSALFRQIDLFLDAKTVSGRIEGDTILVWAMVLEADGDCEVRSWSRKVERAALVSQMVHYMQKAAREYEEFRKHPDVTRNFKCIYI